MYNALTNAFNTLINGRMTTITTANFGGGINGTAEEASATEFISSSKSAGLHDILLELQNLYQ